MLKELLLAIIGAVFGLLANELGSWGPKLAKMLSRSLVGLAPADVRERLMEEALSHIDEIPGPISKVIVAVGFGWAAIRVRIERNYPGERRLDLLVSGMIFLGYSPFWLLFAAALMIEGRRPPLRRVLREHRGGRSFYAYEFNVRHDCRSLLTPSGLFNRSGAGRTFVSLSILTGDLSLFGPNFECQCGFCEAGRVDGAVPGLITLEKLEVMAQKHLGMSPPMQESSTYRRSIRCLMIVTPRLMRLAFRQKRKLKDF